MMQCVRLYVYACLLNESLERWVYVLCCVACMNRFCYIERNIKLISDGEGKNNLNCPF